MMSNYGILWGYTESTYILVWGISISYTIIENNLLNEAVIRQDHDCLIAAI